MVSESVAQIEPSPALRPRSRNALIPIALVIVLTFEEIFRAGGGFAVLASEPGQLATLEGWTQILFAGGGAGPLFRAASVALVVGACLVGSRVLRVSVALAVLAAALGAGALETRLSVLLPEGLASYAAHGLIFGIAATATAFAARGLTTPGPHLAWGEIRAAALSSTSALGFAIAILFLAWMIGAVCVEIGTADYLVALTSGNVAPGLIPVLLFFVACVVAFSTGTSWGTMSILLPNVVALAAAAGEQHALGSLGMVTICIGAVLEGSIFGDHCSPISDTTVLSSIASGSDHIDHVRTQLPYALTVAVLALLAGYLPSIWLTSWSFPMAFASGMALALVVLFAAGRKA
ncbi:MAG: hypothetical protein GY725_02790 [bacterium]|nr:hypothetical protein [bacterium]